MAMAAAAMAAAVVGAQEASPSMAPYAYTVPDAAAYALADSLIAAAAAVNTTYTRLAYATTVFGPRFSGTPALELALDWVATTAANEDNLRVIQQPVWVPTWIRGNESATMVAPRNWVLRSVGIGMTNSTGGVVVQAPVLCVTSQAELTAAGAAAVGKIILFNVPFTTYGATVAYRANAGVWAAAAGGVGALIRSVAPFGIQTPHTGGGATASVYAAAVSLEDANMLCRLQSYGMTPEVALYSEARQVNDSLSRNIILEVPGAELPDEYVVIGGHSDSWDNAAGAMDDGGGSFASWEALRLITALGIKPKRTIRAVFWVNEENGARGGAAYASGFAATLPNTSIAIECDEGAFQPFGLIFSGYPSAVNQVTLLGRLLARIGAGNVTAYPGATGTDVAATCATGVPCGGLVVEDPRIGSASNNPCVPYNVDAASDSPFQISNGYFWYHHTAADTIERMDSGQLQAAAAALAVWAVSIANLPTLLPRCVFARLPCTIQCNAPTPSHSPPTPLAQ